MRQLIIRRFGLQRWALARVDGAADLAVAVALAAFAVITLVTASRDHLEGREPDALAYGLALLVTLPVAVRRRWTFPVLVAVAAGMVVFGLREYAGPNVNFFGPVLAFYTVAAHRPRRVSAVVAVVLIMLVWTTTTIAYPEESVIANALNISAIIWGVWFLGDTVRSRREYAERIAAQAAALEMARSELADRAVNEERLRIARELHDVVAHHMSSIVVQAAVAQDRLEADPPAAQRALRQVEELGRNALGEMRQILGVLRQEGERQGALTPAPSVGDLERLYQAARDGGVAVEVDAGELRGLTPSVELAAYRVVQEALTNAVKHAPGSTVRVRLSCDAGALSVEVRDDGTGMSSTGGRSNGTGHGLIGMRERIALLGGTFQAGPAAEGGFRVAARLPLGGAS